MYVCLTASSLRICEKRSSFSLVARREKKLREVAEKAREFGSPDAIIVCGDVSKSNDCKRFVEETVNHFGRLNHLVNNAGINSGFYFEESKDISSSIPVMDVNFWGSIYPTQFALPQLIKNKGKIVVVASPAGWLYGPCTSIYGASKAALVNFYDTLRVEFGSSVTITIASPGYTDSEMTQGKHLTLEGIVEVNTKLRDAVIGIFPVKSASECCKNILNAVCRGDRYVTDPSWFTSVYVCKFFIPEIVEWFFGLLLVILPSNFMKNAAANTN
ncbi:hypothetical protein AQUCO_01100091v1 [Aquilegia coerulea]|uniref:Uncharacterized protein n=1 Tax=Aquilegia coerulea TaxID=218851 RepID=A0A2G5E5P2_AQUCA|nr:hypothetical protein AQUCO_01100091v1 [Aquilegia coerulea]